MLEQPQYAKKSGCQRTIEVSRAPSPTYPNNSDHANLPTVTLKATPVDVAQRRPSKRDTPTTKRRRVQIPRNKASLTPEPLPSVQEAARHVQRPVPASHLPPSPFHQCIPRIQTASTPPPRLSHANTYLRRKKEGNKASVTPSPIPVSRAHFHVCSRGKSTYRGFLPFFVAYTGRDFPLLLQPPQRKAETAPVKQEINQAHFHVASPSPRPPLFSRHTGEGKRQPQRWKKWTTRPPAPPFP